MRSAIDSVEPLRKEIAGLVELADALASNPSGRKSVRVRVPRPAPEFMEGWRNW